MFRRGRRSNHDPNEPHEFVRREETRMGDVFLSERMPGSTFGNIASIATAGASIRDLHCAVPGCGKPQSDPIHWPAEE